MGTIPFQQLNYTYNAIQKASKRGLASQSKLASGQKIQSAKDNAASLAISINLDAEIRSLQQASRNTSEGINVLRTAEGAMSSNQDALIRMKELAVQAGSTTLSDDQRAMIQEELEGLKEHMGQVAGTTEYNGQNLVDGSQPDMTFQVGSGNSPDDQIVVELPDITPAALGVDGGSVLTSGDAHALLDQVDAAMDTLAEAQTEVGAGINRMESAFDNTQESIVNNSATLSQLRDTDYAAESTEYASSLIGQEIGVAMLAHQNTTSSQVLKLLG